MKINPLLRDLNLVFAFLPLHARCYKSQYFDTLETRKRRRKKWNSIVWTLWASVSAVVVLKPFIFAYSTTECCVTFQNGLFSTLLQQNSAARHNFPLCSDKKETFVQKKKFLKIKKRDVVNGEFYLIFYFIRFSQISIEMKRRKSWIEFHGMFMNFYCLL